MQNVTLPELIAALAAQGHISKKDAETFIRTMLSRIEERLLAEGTVQLSGLGTFRVQWNEERKSVDVTTGRENRIPAHRKLTFSVDETLKDFVNQPYAHLGVVELNGETGKTPLDEGLSDAARMTIREQATEISSLLSDILAMPSNIDTRESEVGITTESKSADRGQDEKQLPTEKRETMLGKQAAEVSSLLSDILAMPSNLGEENHETGIANEVSAVVSPAEHQTQEETVAVASGDVETINSGIDNREMVQAHGEGECIQENEVAKTSASSSGYGETNMTDSAHTEEISEKNTADVVTGVAEHEQQESVAENRDVQPNETGEESETHDEEQEQDNTTEDGASVVEKRKGCRGWWIVLLIVLLGAIGGAVGYFYVYPKMQKVEEEETAADVQAETPAQNDETTGEDAECPTAEDEYEMTDPAEMTPSMTYDEFDVRACAFTEVQISAGERLASLSRQYYGTHVFWPYIYWANLDRLSSPDNLTEGMTLRIPDVPYAMRDTTDVNLMGWSQSDNMLPHIESFRP